MRSHRAHARVREWVDGREIALCGHALAETCSVLTRLPGDLRVAPVDAVRLLDDGFSAPLALSREASQDLVATLARSGVAGGATHDALVGLAAREHDVALATRDARARGTCDLIGARVLVVV